MYEYHGLWPIGSPMNETIADERLLVFGPEGQFWLIGCWIGIILSSTAFVTSMVFPKQRSFPTCYSAWFCGIDAIQFTREMLKYSNIGALSEALAWSQTPATCALTYLWDVVVESLQFVCNISLSVIIFLSIVKKVDVTYHAQKWWLLGVCIALIVYPTVYTTIIGSVIQASGGYFHTFFSCSPYNPIGSILGIVQTGVAVIIEVSLIGYCILYVKRVFESVSDLKANPSQNKLIRLCIKLVTLIFLQTVPRITLGINFLILIDFINRHPLPHDPATAALFLKTERDGGLSVVISTLLCYWLNAIIVMYSNSELRQALGEKVRSVISESFFTTSSSSSSRRSTGGDSEERERVMGSSTPDVENAKVIDHPPRL